MAHGAVRDLPPLAAWPTTLTHVKLAFRGVARQVPRLPATWMAPGAPERIRWQARSLANEDDASSDDEDLEESEDEQMQAQQQPHISATLLHDLLAPRLRTLKLSRLATTAPARRALPSRGPHEAGVGPVRSPDAAGGGALQPRFASVVGRLRFLEARPLPHDRMCPVLRSPTDWLLLLPPHLQALDASYMPHADALNFADGAPFLLPPTLTRLTLRFEFTQASARAFWRALPPTLTAVHVSNSARRGAVLAELPIVFSSTSFVHCSRAR